MLELACCSSSRQTSHRPKHTTKTKSKENQNKQEEAPSLITTSQNQQQHKVSTEKQYDHKRPAPCNKLTIQMQFLNVQKMDQR
jgi:hypothetical protein